MLIFYNDRVIDVNALLNNAYSISFKIAYNASKNHYNVIICGELINGNIANYSTVVYETSTKKKAKEIKKRIMSAMQDGKKMICLKPDIN